jgi:hypothetical protein
MSGVFAVNREVWDHPMFAPEPFTEREAWIWMCGAAAYKPMKARCGRAVVSLQRGQLAFATRFLARKWKWSEARVRRFLNRLEIDAAVTLHATRETTQITICNYDKHQFSRRTDDAPSDAQTDAPATHPRRKEEELNKSKMQDAPKSALVLIEEPSDEKDLFARGKKVLGQSAGGLIASLLKSKKGSVPQARAAIEIASTKQDAREFIGRIIAGSAEARDDVRNPLAGIK